ncbi:hypothetical protein ABK040_010501 [Willaertia magna]
MENTTKKRKVDMDDSNNNITAVATTAVGIFKLNQFPTEILTHIIEYIEDYNSTFNFIKINKEIFYSFYNKHPLFSINKINEELQQILNYSSKLSTKTGFDKILNKLQRNIKDKLREINDLTFFREMIAIKNKEIQNYINLVNDKPLQEKLQYLFSILKYNDIAQVQTDEETWFTQICYSKDNYGFLLIAEGNTELVFKKKSKQFKELESWLEKEGIPFSKFFKFLCKVMYDCKEGTRLHVYKFEE